MRTYQEYEVNKSFQRHLERELIQCEHLGVRQVLVEIEVGIEGELEQYEEHYSRPHIWKRLRYA